MRPVLRTVLWALAAATAALAASPAAADVVVLEGNDVPLTGRILEETPDTLVFRIHGLGEQARMTIEKSRVKAYWREDNSYIEYVRNETERKERIAELTSPDTVTEESPAGPLLPRAPAPPRGRTGAEIRQDMFASAWEEALGALPSFPGSGLAYLAACAAVLAGLIFGGGRVAGIPRMTPARAAGLAAVTGVLAWCAFTASGRVVLPEFVPLLVLAEALVWLAAVRILAGGTLGKGLLLLTLCLGTILLVGGTAFSILSVF